MTPKPPFVIFMRWTIYIFLLLMVSAKVEHKISLAVGTHLSSDYAQWIADLHKSADALKAKDPDGFQHVTTRMGFASMAVYAVTAAIIAAFVVWWRRDSRGMPNKSPEPTAVGAGSSAIAAHVTSRRWLSFLR